MLMPGKQAFMRVCRWCQGTDAPRNAPRLATLPGVRSARQGPTTAALDAKCERGAGATLREQPTRTLVRLPIGTTPPDPSAGPDYRGPCLPDYPTDYPMPNRQHRQKMCLRMTRIADRQEGPADQADKVPAGPRNGPRRMLSQLSTLANATAELRNCGKALQRKAAALGGRGVTADGTAATAEAHFSESRRTCGRICNCGRKTRLTFAGVRFGVSLGFRVIAAECAVALRTRLRTRLQRCPDTRSSGARGRRMLRMTRIAAPAKAGRRRAAAAVARPVQRHTPHPRNPRTKKSDWEIGFRWRDCRLSTPPPPGPRRQVGPTALAMPGPQSAQRRHVGRLVHAIGQRLPSIAGPHSSPVHQFTM